MIHLTFAIWSLVPRAFRKPACTSGNSRCTKSSNRANMIRRRILLVCEMRAIVRLFSHRLVSPFFGMGMYTDLFQSLGHSPDCHMELHSAVIAVTPSFIDCSYTVNLLLTLSVSHRPPVLCWCLILSMPFLLHSEGPLVPLCEVVCYTAG